MRLSFSAAAIFVVLMSALAVAAQPGVVDHFAAGYKAYEEKRFDDAVKSYTLYIAAKPRNANAYLNRGLAYQKLLKNDLAIADFTRAIALEPNAVDHVRARGDLYGQMVPVDVKKYLPLAVADLTKAIQLSPRTFYAYFYRGRAYKYAFDDAKAISDLTKAIEIQSDLADAYSLRGQAYAGLKKWDLAKSDFARYKQLGGDASNADNWLGYVERERTKTTTPVGKAVAPARTAAPVAGSSDPVQNAYALLRAGRTDQAMAAFQNVIDTTVITKGSVAEDILTNQVADSYKGQAEIQIKNMQPGKAADSCVTANKMLLARVNAGVQGVQDAASQIRSTPYADLLIPSFDLQIGKGELFLISGERANSIAKGCVDVLVAAEKNDELLAKRFAIATLWTTIRELVGSVYLMNANYRFLNAASCRDTAKQFCGAAGGNNKISDYAAKALKDVTRAIELIPYNKNCYLIRAKIYGIQGKNDLAAADNAKAATMKG